MRIGVLGGTFDPVHNGHIIIAGEVRERLGLAEVVFVPAGMPWFRDGAPAARPEQRLEMVRRAVTGRPGCRVSAVDIERRGPTRTVDTISDLQAGLGGGAELYLILGQDNLAEVPRWYRPEELIRMCRLVAVPRPGFSTPDLGVLETALPGVMSRVLVLDGPRLDISATDIRRRVALGEPVDHLVPEAVAEYIRQNGLYLEP